MRAARPRLAVLLLHACSCVLVEGFALRAAKDPRRGVIQQLFGSSWSGPNILKPLRPSMTKRKETLLRGKIAAKRSFVDQINREIAALDARSCVVTGPERKAHETRVAILRRRRNRRVDVRHAAVYAEVSHIPRSRGGARGIPLARP